METEPMFSDPAVPPAPPPLGDPETVERDHPGTGEPMVEVPGDTLGPVDADPAEAGDPESPAPYVERDVQDVEDDDAGAP